MARVLQVSFSFAGINIDADPEGDRSVCDVPTIRMIEPSRSHCAMHRAVSW